jgi:hypothetical protein
MTIWGSVPGRGDVPGRDWLQPTVQVVALCLALLFAVVPRRKTVTQLAALGAALLIASQLAATNWAPNYLVWFAPLAFIGLFASYDATSRARPLRLRRALSAPGQARSG